MKKSLKSTSNLLFLSLLLTSCAGPPRDKVLTQTSSKDTIESDKNIIFIESEINPGIINVDKEIVETAKDKSNERAPSSEEKEFAKYTVKENDTLIMISYNIYGNHRHWKELRRLNQDKIEKDGKIQRGKVIKYRRPKEKFVRPDGRAYFVKKGDTLSIISDKVYGDWKEWPIIWHNNKTIIQDPELIFAGLTIYYPNLREFKNTDEYFRISEVSNPYDFP